MAIHGSLLTMPLSDLLGWVKTTLRSGSLLVTRDGNEWELVLTNGRVTGYGGPELRDYLGQIIVTSGLLTEEDLRQAYQLRREYGGSLHQALLGSGMLSHDQLQECLTELACESIYDLFLELPGDFVFSEQKSPVLGLELDDIGDHLPLDLDVNHLLMEGATRQDEWKHVRERFPHDDIDVVIVDDNLGPIENLTVRERRILASLESGQSLTDICLELRAPIASVLRALAELEKKGAVRISETALDAPAAADSGKVEHLVEQSTLLREAGQYDEAIALLEVAIRMRPDHTEARRALRECLEGQIQELYTALPPVKVPALVVDEARLSRLRLRSEERFLVDRLGAGMDVGSLIMISSMSERETLKTLRRLMHGGVIALR
jgi:tetratricopeptide (TPR) repeat protein